MSDFVCASVSASGRVRCPVAVRDWAWRCLFSCKSYSIKQQVDASAHHSTTTIPQNNRPLHRRPSTAPAPISPHRTHVPDTSAAQHTSHTRPQSLAWPTRSGSSHHRRRHRTHPAGTTSTSTSTFHSPQSIPPHIRHPHSTALLPSQQIAHTHKDDHNTHAHKHNAKA